MRIAREYKTKQHSNPPKECFSSVYSVVLIVVCLLWLHSAQAAPAPPPKPKPAEINISGYGLLGNRELKRTLLTLELGGKKPEYLTPDFVEDATLILAARLRRDGYLNPSITVRLTVAGGEY